jgi:hypothetical protein
MRKRRRKNGKTGNCPDRESRIMGWNCRYAAGSKFLCNPAPLYLAVYQNMEKSLH